MTSTQTSGYSLLHRTAIAVCLGTGLFFAFRAATPDAQATAAVPAVTVSPTVDAAVPDTELTTCNIEDIQAGDLVLARDEHGQEIGLKPVKEVYKRTSFHLRHLTFESADGDQQTLSTTDEHPFWSVTADEFVEAGSLPVGHQVTDPHGKTQTLVGSTREEFPNGIPVFNFQVEDFHTYYVAAHAGDDVLLVHNADYDDLYGPFYHSTTDDVIAKIKESEELWGKAPRNYFGSNFPKAKAWDGPLPAGVNGVEFYTAVKPDTWINKGMVLWNGAQFDEWAKIPIRLAN
ncbi:MAG: polymorphic toxin-type HINT domain-containing protein [Fuerstiella sp.]